MSAYAYRKMCGTNTHAHKSYSDELTGMRMNPVVFKSLHIELHSSDAQVCGLAASLTLWDIFFSASNMQQTYARFFLLPKVNNGILNFARSVLEVRS